MAPSHKQEPPENPERFTYPDFVAMLVDGRTLVVEYKGGHLADDAKDKKSIGDLWAEASDGACLFDMPIDGDFARLRALLA